MPDFVHVLADGRIVKSGDKDLALELEEKGYAGRRGGRNAMTPGKCIRCARMPRDASPSSGSDLPAGGVALHNVSSAKTNRGCATVE